jgi:HK97 family phage major capsid protein
MPKEVIEQLDGILAEVEDIDAAITREERLVKQLGDTPAAEHEAALNAATRDTSRQDNRDEGRALRAFLMGGVNALDEQQRQRMTGRQNAEMMQAMALLNPQAAMSTGVPAEGGYTTAPEYQRELEEALKTFGGIRQLVSQIRTATGNVMYWPTADSTAEEGEIVGESTDVTGQDTTFGQASLTVYKYSSKKIALPWELLQDSMFDIEAYIKAVLARRLGRISNKHFVTGTGTGQPKGVLTASTVGKTGATGQTLTVTYDDLVDLEHSVDPAYRVGAGFTMHDSSVKVVRKIKDADGRPIFIPGYEQGNPGGAPDRLLGRPINVIQEMPVMAANAKSILFGQLKSYLIRDVMDLTLFRMTDSAFTLKGQVGFVAFQRMGGNLIDVGGAVKHYANSAT